MRPKACLVTICAAALVLGLSSGAGLAYTYKKLYDFCSKQSCVDGAAPQAGLVVDSSGNLYGTTTGGGFNNGGTVFELSFNASKHSWKYQRLHTFCRELSCADGGAPYGTLIIDTAGNLYGTTYQNGAYGLGTVFELTPGAAGHKAVFKLLYTFPTGLGHSMAGLSYAGQSSGLAYDGTSAVFGTGVNSGSQQQGSLFMLTPGTPSWTYSDLHDFCVGGGRCHDGSGVVSGVILDADGDLFGTTQNTAFELSPAAPGGHFTVLYTACENLYCKQGSNLHSSLLMDSTGDLLGTAIYGGDVHHGCCGVLYELTQAGHGWNHGVVYDFCSRRDCDDGQQPQGPLIMAASGALVGTTPYGGGNTIDDNHAGGGTVYSLSGTALITLYAFCAQSSCADGEYPYAGVVEDMTGNLFGTTAYGGNSDLGVVFELTP